jgi:valyl-tRNA synthetase
MSKKDLLKHPYQPKETEKTYHFDYTFDPLSKKPPFCIIMPPPNVTGALHMGHALVTTIQDLLVRFHRMNGYEVAWIPGTDHAGIATQSVVEKKLLKETGKRRLDFEREEFIKHIVEWKDLHKEKITSQIKRLGSSANWSKELFTLDEKANKAVRTVFKKLFDEGLIYRGFYLVNWDTHLQTAIADDEVEHEEVHSHLWYFSYPIFESEESIIIATSRPETMLGDTAVAVNGSDERYLHLIGKKIKLPLSDRLVPIIADSYVDKEFGTGAVKITPVHDFNDYEIGQRHHLEMINIMNSDGTINEHGGVFKGLSMIDCRLAVVEKMRQLHLLVKIEPHTHRVGLSYRSKSVVEPFLSKQWFLNMEPFKEKLLSAVFDEKVELIPKEWEKTYRHWIENIRNWCISRQLWWGHRIPIWYDKEDESNILCYSGEGIPEEVIKEPSRYIQEEDVLDTWFSSALWPLTCLGWPEKTPDIQKFYPTSILVTGHDILFFWVARMILMGEYALNKVPFKKVFLHGLIFAKSYFRQGDKGLTYLSKQEWIGYEKGEKIPKDVSYKWEKMSKSKGNVIDPIDIIDEFGTDALRLALCSSVTTAKQIDLDFRKFEEGKNFANKVWNATSFVVQNIFPDLSATLSEEHFGVEDRFILSKLSTVIKEAHNCIEQCNFSFLHNTLQSFFWDDYCAYYLEISKPFLYGKIGSHEQVSTKKWILLYTLTSFIQLLHPIAPFITEELFSILKELVNKVYFPEHPLSKELKATFNQSMCGLTQLPSWTFFDHNALALMEEFKQTLYVIRNIRGESNISPGEKLFIEIEEKNSPLKERVDILQALTKIHSIEFYQTFDEPLFPVSIVQMKSRKIRIKIPHELLAREKVRLSKSLVEIQKNLEVTSKQLSNKEFVERAPKELIEEKRNLLEVLEKSKQEIESKLLALS